MYRASAPASGALSTGLATTIEAAIFIGLVLFLAGAGTWATDSGGALGREAAA
jgi:hypothetical protein